MHLNLIVPEKIVKNGKKIKKFQDFQLLIVYFKKMYEFLQYLYMEKYCSLIVSSEVWKCFRCNLTFKEEQLAKLHEEISKHSVSSEKLIDA